jgi:HxlR-like helix-turn-helix
VHRYGELKRAMRGVSDKVLIQQLKELQMDEVIERIQFNAFEMNCVGHQSPGLWSHLRDRLAQYKDLES